VPVHKAQVFPISVVQLTVANLEEKDMKRYNTYIRARADERTGEPYVFINTRGAEAYSDARLADNDPAKVATELEKGLVSFNATVILRGAGANKLEGVSSIHLGWLQTIVATTLKVTYRTGSAEYQPMDGGQPLPPPWLDSNRPARPPNAAVGTGGESSFVKSSNEQRDDQNAAGRGKQRRVVSLDAPGIMFRVTNPATNDPWTKTEGGWSFVNHLTAFSTADAAAPTHYTVIAVAPWTVSYVGSKDGRGNWDKDATETKVVFGSTRSMWALPDFGAMLTNTFTDQGPVFHEATDKGRLVYKG